MAIRTVFSARRCLALALGAAATAGCVGQIAEGDSSSTGSGTGGSGGAGTIKQLACTDAPFVRRLTVTEYANAVQAVLGVDIHSEAASTLPKDLRADGFSNTSGSLIVTVDHAAGYEQLAQSAVEKIGDFSGFLQQYTTCTDFADSCEQQLIEGFGENAYRRPLNNAEVSALRPLFAVAKDEGEDFFTGARLVLQAMLQSPPFVYRMENELGADDIRELDGWEMASRLSFLIWGAPPDEKLFSAARANELSSDAQIEAQVDRLLADPRARATARRYAHDWLNLGRLDNLSRDADKFPDWKADLGRAMQDETLQFFEQITFGDRPLADLLDAQLTFASPELAAHYGFDEAASGEYDLSDIPERGGLLTQGAMSTVGGDTSSMVGRGLFIFENVLCGHIDSPPPGVDTTPPAVGAGASQRVHSEGRVEAEACGSCHSVMEPVAWGLERFDATGRYRESDEFGNDLLQDGYVKSAQTGDKQTYSTTAELMSVLANSDDVVQCLSRKSTQFALGRPLAPDEDVDACTLDEVWQKFADSPRSYRDLVLAIALSKSFRRITTQ